MNLTQSKKIGDGLQASGLAVAVNIVLAVAKITTGIVGNTYVLIADGLESTLDVFSSIVVWSGLRISRKPPDQNHPYGHGKAESIAALAVALFLLSAAFLLAFQSIREILSPQRAPAGYTLWVLATVIVVKELLYRFVFRVAHALRSTSLRSDAWHHRSDAITSLAGFVGISLALVAGPGYESADDWAALVGCAVIVTNGILLLRPALDEVMDAAVPKEVEGAVRRLSESVTGVLSVEKCRIRKSGLGFLMDIHVTVDSNLSVRKGHEIGHVVKDRLSESGLGVHDVVVHIEPDDLVRDT